MFHQSRVTKRTVRNLDILFGSFIKVHGADQPQPGKKEESREVQSSRHHDVFGAHIPYPSATRLHSDTLSVLNPRPIYHLEFVQLIAVWFSSSLILPCRVSSTVLLTTKVIRLTIPMYSYDYQYY